MKKLKLQKIYLLSNNLDIKFILGPCQIESKSHAFDVCDEISETFKKNLNFNLFMKVLLIKLIEVVIRVKEVLELIKDLIS